MAVRHYTEGPFEVSPQKELHGWAIRQGGVYLVGAANLRDDALMWAASLEMYEALERLEWSGGADVPACPMCHHHEPEHESACLVGRALTAARGEERER